MPHTPPDARRHARARVFRADSEWRRRALLGGGILLGAAVSLALISASSAWDNAAYLVAAVLALAGLLVIAAAYAARLTISTHTLELRTLFTWKTAALMDVVGYDRLHDALPAGYLRLYVEPLGHRIDIPMCFGPLDELARALPHAADLDAAPNGELGRKIARAASHDRRLFNGLPVLGLAVAVVFGGLFAGLDWRTTATLIALIPLLDLLLHLAWTRRTPFNPAHQQRREHALLFSLYACGGFLLYQILREVITRQWSAMIPATLAATGLMMVLTGIGHPRTWLRSLHIVPGIIVYAAGAIALANIALDTGIPQHSTATVLARHYSSGRHKSWQLQVRPSTSGAPDTYSVSGVTFERTRVGDTLCIGRHPGWFGAHWFDIAPMEQCAARR